MSLNENIRKLRKEKGMTQEQLAEVMGITVGAVSKWESGLSNPDISLLPKLAELFGISIDVLFDYQVTITSAGELVKELRELRFAKRYDEAVRKAEEGLKRYPNHFELVYHAAFVFRAKGMERHDKTALKRALELYFHASTLFSQNTSEDICELDIHRGISGVYVQLGENEKALERLKKYNYCGIHEGAIGQLLAKEARYQEALPYLSNSLLEGFEELFNAVIGFVICYEKQGNGKSAMEILEWMYAIAEGLKLSGKTSYMDKIQATLLVSMACLHVGARDWEQAKERLRQARKEALLFDGEPVYSSENIRFLCEEERVFMDTFGESAMESIQRIWKESSQDAGTWKESSKDAGTCKESSQNVEAWKNLWREIEEEEKANKGITEEKQG